MGIGRKLVSSMALSGLILAAAACSRDGSVANAASDQDRPANISSSPADTNSAPRKNGLSGEDATFTPKVFAHRFNSLAENELKIIEITPPGGFRGARRIFLNLAASRQYIATNERYDEFDFSGNQLPNDQAKRVCSWMLQSFNPAISSSEASSAASAVIDEKKKLIVKNTILDVYPTKYEKGCSVSATGL